MFGIIVILKLLFFSSMAAGSGLALVYLHHCFGLWESIVTDSDHLGLFTFVLKTFERVLHVYLP